MRGKGINYDTGFFNAGTSTHEPFEPAAVAQEMRVIREDLHCTAVRITGGDPDRLEIAATHAADAGLEIWFCPFTNGLSQDELLALLADCAGRAERLRARGANVVMLTGSEISLGTAGFLPGDTLEERLAVIADPERVRSAIGQVRVSINAFLRRAVDAVRARFHGPVSYASLPFEGVAWTPFDIIATDAGYRSRDTAAQYRDLMRAFVAQGREQDKPVAITEFGCGTFRGASDVAHRGVSNIAYDGGRPAHIVGEYARDEDEQATYLRELIDVFKAEGIDSAFVYTFARYDLPHRRDASLDLDLASYGVVKIIEPAKVSEPERARYPGMRWEPKAAFDALARCYAADESARAENA